MYSFFKMAINIVFFLYYPIYTWPKSFGTNNAELIRIHVNDIKKLPAVNNETFAIHLRHLRRIIGVYSFFYGYAYL